MKCSLKFLWMASLLFCSVLLSGEARVNTEVQAGPLYRVVGSLLSISCNVTDLPPVGARNEFEFRMKKPENPNFEINIISTGDEDFSFARYTSRVRNAEITLTHVGENSVVFEVQRLQKDDEGEYECSVVNPYTEYDGAYSAKTIVKVVPDMSSLVVRISVQQTTLQEGQQLSVTCSVDTQNLREKFFSVAWLREGVELAQIGPTGVLSAGPDYSAREQEGELRAARIGDRDYRLILQPVRTKDQGEYICRAWSQDRGQNGVFTQGAAQDSSPQLPEKHIQQCLFSSCMILVFVSSYALFSSVFTSVISLSQEGVMEKSEGFINRKVKALRPAHDTFTLELADLTPSDSGDYQCTVSEWKTNSKTNSASGSTSVIVKPVGTLTSTPALTRNINTDVKMKCSVSSPTSTSSRYAVTWLLQQHGENKTIVSTDRDALVTFGQQVELNQMQRISMSRTQGPGFELTIRQARSSDKGLYTCEVVEWLQDPRGEWFDLPPTSKSTQLTIIEPANDLHLNKTTQHLNVMEGTDVELKCSLISAAPGASFFYRVMWRYTRLNSSIVSAPLVELDHTGLLRYPPNPKVRHLQGRLRLSRPSQSSFHLGLQGVHEEDSGTYECQVEQYQLDQDGQWQQKASDNTGPITLTVNVAGMIISLRVLPRQVYRYSYISS
uniref:Zgc:91849 n=1 Tax=Sphaeramia orbicularis TaxID=375764 RepID=A0A673AUI1_9TELE